MRPPTLIAEATIDCYNGSECVTGFYTMIEDNLAVPFQTVVLGMDVTAAHSAAGRCGPPEGVEWIEACRHWV